MHRPGTIPLSFKSKVLIPVLAFLVLAPVVTLTIQGKDGSQVKRRVDGDWGGRFERGMSTYVTLLGIDLRLEDIDRITVAQDGSGWASDWYLERILARQADKTARSCVFQAWIKEGKAVSRPCT